MEFISKSAAETHGHEAGFAFARQAVEDEPTLAGDIDDDTAGELATGLAANSGISGQWAAARLAACEDGIRLAVRTA